MLKKNIINKIIQIKEFHCKINLEMEYYSKHKGTIKGIKKLQAKKTIYLVEFFDHNRIWVIRAEFNFL